MDNTQLKKLQSLELVIASEIKRICGKNHINYSIVGGALIGAVRHGGFIPWDDDLDIGMTREEYNRFKAACETDLNNQFIYQDWHTDDSYHHAFTKILLSGTSVIQHGQEYANAQRGIFVDVFPFDNVPEKSSQRWIQSKKNRLFSKMLRQTAHLDDDPNWSFFKKTTFHFFNLLDKVISRKYLVHLCEMNMTKFSARSTYQITSMAGYYGYDREIIPSSWFDTYSEIDFCGESFQVISEYKEFLANLYGDYMQLPPVSDRRTHEFEVLDFGKY